MLLKEKVSANLLDLTDKSILSLDAFLKGSRSSTAILTKNEAKGNKLNWFLQVNIDTSLFVTLKTHIF